MRFLVTCDHSPDPHKPNGLCVDPILYPPKPLLGLVTTRQLLEELKVRFEISTPDQVARNFMRKCLEGMSEEKLNYRTLDL